MTISPGTRLGPYEIVSPIGAGGMGEVYRARDTRLDRSVAVKVLPSEFAQNAQLRIRFEREAKTISQLTHPHICTLHDVGTDNGVEYLVMELLDGESLAARLARGPLPLPEVLRLGAQIADGLAQAHAHGVVHRDLKPGNIMVTKSGAKLVDFGLSKQSAFTQAPPSVDDATQHKALTGEGTILGTYQYMAPEQLAGEDAGARSDIFALGAVLYEMAAGQRAFQGKTRASLIAAITGGEPQPLKERQPLTPPALEHVIVKCLAKDPERRWHSAADVADELRWIERAGSAAGIAPPVMAWRKKRERIGWLLHGVTALVAIAAAAAWFELRETPGQPIASAILPPPGYRMMTGGGSIALSPDESLLVMLVEDARANRMLCIRPLEAAGVRFISGSEDAQLPFWSPDSKQIAFFSGTQLKTVDVNGGPVQPIASVLSPRGGIWAPDGTIVYAPDIKGPLMKVPSSGGAPVPASVLRPGELSHRFPSLFPDGRHFAYVATDGAQSVVWEGALDDATQHRAIVNGSNYALAPFRGWLFYARDRALVAQRLDRSRNLMGPVVLIAEDVAANGLSGLLACAGSDGTVIYEHDSPYPQSQLTWVDRNGREIERVSDRGVFFCPATSHDGRRVAFDMSDPVTGMGDIWIRDLVRKRTTRLTYEPGNESAPTWSPDDKRIYYLGDSAGHDDVCDISSGGTVGGERLFIDTYAKRPTDLSPDGRWLIFNSGPNRLSTLTDIWVYSVEEKKARPWLATPFGEANARFSPDGKWIAYQSNESGRNEIYVRAFPDSDEKWPISTGGGTMPSWRGDGREIYYVSGESRMMAVAVKPGAAFETETPVALFATELRPHIARQYDVTPDGSKFLLNNLVDISPPEPVTLLQNWTARFAKQAPAR